jgi:hypothetical protein
MEPVKERLRDVIDKGGYGTLALTMVPRDEQIELLEKYPEDVKAFRDFMRKEVYPHPDDHEDYSWEETDFSGFTEGFFCARGVPPLDAKLLDTLLRYNLQYFDPDLETRAEKG